MAAMLARRKQVGSTQQIQIRLRVIAADLIADFFDANHKTPVVRGQWPEAGKP
jgi:hypothetical protein